MVNIIGIVIINPQEFYVKKGESYQLYLVL